MHAVGVDTMPAVTHIRSHRCSVMDGEELVHVAFDDACLADTQLANN